MIFGSGQDLSMTDRQLFVVGRGEADAQLSLGNAAG